MMIGHLRVPRLDQRLRDSRDPLGVITSAWMPVWIMFSTICICFSTSIFPFGSLH